MCVWGRGRGGVGSAYHAKLRQMQMRSLYSAWKEREEREGEWMGSENCRRQLWQEGEGGGLPQTLEACCLCQLKADAANWRLFGQQQKNIKAPFKGLAGSLLQGGGRWLREREGNRGPINNLPSQKCTEHETGWGEGADRENYGHYVIKYLKCCRRMPMEKDSVPEILPTATTMEHAYVLTK